MRQKSVGLATFKMAMNSNIRNRRYGSENLAPFHLISFIFGQQTQNILNFHCTYDIQTHSMEDNNCYDA